MICCSTCWCTVGFSIGTRTSTRRSRLRGIQSAEEMKTRALVEGIGCAVGEGDDAGVLQEAADDALDPDVLRQARNAGPQAADAADDQVDRHAGLAGGVEGVDDLRIDQGVQLGPDGGRLARPWRSSPPSAISWSRSRFRVIGEKESFSSRSGWA